MAHAWSTTLDDAPPPAPSRRRWLRGLSALAVLLIVVGGAPAGMAAPGEPEDDVGEPTEDGVEDADLVPDEHAAAIAAYWQERDAAFAHSGEAGATFVASRLHPDLGYSVESCLRAWFPDGTPERLSQKVTLHEATVAPAPDWQMPHGPLHDTELTDPVYRMHVRIALTGLPSNVDVDQTLAVHLAVFDGRAYGFAACVEPSVVRTIIDQLASGPAAPITFGSPSGPSDTAPPDPQMVTPGASLVSPPDGPPPPPPAEPPPAEPPPAEPPPAEPPPAEEPSLIPTPSPADPGEIAPPPIPWPTFPPRESPTPDASPDASPGWGLTVEEELYIVLLLVDGLMQHDLLTVAEAIDLLAELAEAPELDDDQRALVEENLRLLRVYAEDPQGDPPRLHLRVDPETGEVVEDGADDERPHVSEAVRRALETSCDMVLDVMDGYRAACTPE